MTGENDWFRWGSAWQKQPSVDIDRLRAQVRRRDAKLRMRMIISWTAAAITTSMIALLVFGPTTPMSLRVWAVMLFVLLVVTMAFRMHAVLGLQRELGESGDSVSALLQRSARHARAAVRNAVAGVFVSSVIVLISLIVLVLPRVLPLSQAQATGWQTPWGTAVVCVTVAGAGVVIHALRLRTARRRLKGIRALLRENADDDPAS